MNSTQLSHFRLTAYVDSGPLRYFYFVFLLCLYLLIICSNLLLIVVICLNRSLHEPMYLFLCSLFVNELWGSTGLFPLMLVHILSHVHTVPAPLCFLQVFALHSYGAIELISLTVMSYDRYLAICHPLQYGRMLSSTRVALLVAAIWLYGISVIVISVSWTASLTYCGTDISKVYCDNYPAIRLACSDTTAINAYGLFSTFRALVVPFLVILYTYVRILAVCSRGSKEARQKAASTCTPHLVSILNFTVGCCFEVFQSRFNMERLPNALRVFLSLYFLAGQPLVSPLVFGLSLSKIRLMCKSLLSKVSLKST